MFVMKFNIPILPYSKFPLSFNKYIEEFLNKYEKNIERINDFGVIGVHF